MQIVWAGLLAAGAVTLFLVAAQSATPSVPPPQPPPRQRVVSLSPPLESIRQSDGPVVDTTTSTPPPPPKTGLVTSLSREDPHYPVGLWYFYDEAHNHTAWMFRTTLEAVEPGLPQHSIYLSAAEVKDAPGWSFMVKIRSILQICSLHPGRVVLYADTDIVFFRPFLEDIRGLMAAPGEPDILFQGFPHPVTGKRRRKMINIGFMAMRCTPDTKRLWEGTLSRVADKDGRWLEGRCDQPELQHKSGLTAAWPRWDFLPSRYWISSLTHPRRGALHAVGWRAVPDDPVLCHPDSASGTVKVHLGKVPWKMHFIAEQICGRACDQSNTDCYSRRPTNSPYDAAPEAGTSKARVFLFHSLPRRLTGLSRWVALLSLRRFEPKLAARSVELGSSLSTLILETLKVVPEGDGVVFAQLPFVALREGVLTDLLGKKKRVVVRGAGGDAVFVVTFNTPAEIEFWERGRGGDVSGDERVFVTSRRVGGDKAGVCVVDDVASWMEGGRLPRAYSSTWDWAGLFVTTGLRCGVPARDRYHDWAHRYLPADVVQRAKKGISPLSQSVGPAATDACKPKKSADHQRK
eukprot:Hpha_TRINITY_DN22897_c0_g1::TRINITY_DN22897_c0_g1_i1::g.84358::m.84358